MKNYEATEAAYKNGYKKGYEDAIAFARNELKPIKKLIDECFQMSKALVGDKLSATKTNADRMRAMSDEELADSFTNKCLCDFIPYHTQDHCESYSSCKGCILEWLKQPAEDE